MAIKTHKVTLSLDNPRVIQSGINVQSFDKQSIQISIELTKNDEVFQVPSDATIRISLLKLARQEQKIIVDVPNNNRDSIDWIVPDYLDGYQGTVRVGVYLVSGTENVDLGYFTILSNVSDIDKMADEFIDNAFQGWEQIEADLNELNLTIAQANLDLNDILTTADNTIANINAKNTQVDTLASDFTADVATKQSDATSKYNAFDTSVTTANQTIDDILALQPQFQSVIDETTGKDVISAPEIIVGRGSYATLGERLDGDKAEISAQLADIAVFFSKYKPVGNGIADDAPKLQQALNELPDGGTLHLGGSDKIYRINSRVTVTGKTVHLVANGATLMQGFNGEMFVYTGLFGEPFAVSAVSKETATFGDSGGTIVTKLVAAGHTLKKGDIIKVVSDDLLTGSRQPTARSGEYQVIQSVSGDSIFLSGVLRDIDTYATNVRVAKHFNKTITIDGLNITAASDSIAGNWNFGWLVINGAFKPILKNMQLHDGHAPAITLVGCYAYRLDNIKGHNLTNDPTLGRYGYGINDKGCEYGVATNLHFENVRHGFTTNANSEGANSNRFWRYGRPAYFTVSDSTALGTTNASFDTHEESYGGQFANCTARGVIKGKSSSGSGFTMRGKKLRYDNCRVYDSAVGWQALSAYAGDTDDILIVNCESFGITSATISVNQGSAGSRIKGIKMRGGRHHTTNKFIYNVGGEVDVRNVDVDAPFDSAGLDGVLRVDSGDIYFDELRIDMSGSTSTNIQVIKVQDNAYPADSWSIKGRRLEVVLPAGVNYFARGDGQDATDKLAISDLVLSRALVMTSGLTGSILLTYSITGDLVTTMNGKLNLIGSNPKLAFNNNAEFNFDGVNFNIGAVVDEVLRKMLELKPAELVLNDASSSPYFRVVGSPANGFVGLIANYRVDSVTKSGQLKVGPADSGGAGFRTVIIPN